MRVPIRIALGRRVFAPSWLMTAATLSLLPVFIALGAWQWGRAEYKQRLAAEFSAGSAEQQPLGTRPTATLSRFAAVEVRGQWDGARQFLLDNRTRDGRAGYDVLTPLRLDDGRWLIVDRGWVPGSGFRERLPEVTFALGDGAAVVTLRGRLDDWPTAGLESGRAAPATTGAWPRVTAYPHVADIARALATDAESAPRVEARLLLLDDAEPNGYLRAWRPFVKGPEQNWSYALQWWSFAVLLVVLYVVLNTKKRELS
ncbi:MAG: SURF1 family protein [Gammaproteobacteria bacterium]|nr:SURF1 family protein [Gammaproteobacteria bacterium]